MICWTVTVSRGNPTQHKLCRSIDSRVTLLSTIYGRSKNFWWGQRERVTHNLVIIYAPPLLQSVRQRWVCWWHARSSSQWSWKKSILPCLCSARPQQSTGGMLAPRTPPRWRYWSGKQLNALHQAWRGIAKKLICKQRSMQTITWHDQPQKLVWERD